MNKSAVNNLTTGFFTPTRYFLVAGTGDGNSDLVAFDRALLGVGLGHVNLVKLSSILPPRISNERPDFIKPGTFVGAAFARVFSNQASETIAAAIAVAHPLDEDRESVIMEFAGSSSASYAEEQAKAMAIEALASRNLRLKSVEAMSSQHLVQSIGCALAAVIEL